MKTCLTLLLFFASLSFFAQIKNDTALYKLPSNFVKTKKWIKKDEKRINEPWSIGPIDSTLTYSRAMQIIDSEKNYLTFITAANWCIKNYQTAFPVLISMLTDTKTVGLKNTMDLIIPGRDLPFYGHGGVIYEDIFTVAGRASYILNQLTDEEFAVLRPYTTPAQLSLYQQQWVKWLAQLKTK